MKAITPPNPDLASESDILALSSLFEGVFSLDWVHKMTKLTPTQVLSQLEEGVAQRLLIKKGPGLFCFKNSDAKSKIQARLDAEEKIRLQKVITMSFLQDASAHHMDVRTVAEPLLHITNDSQGCRLLLKAAYLHQKNHSYNKALEAFRKALRDLNKINESETKELFIEAAIGYSSLSTTIRDFEFSEAEADLEIAIIAMNEALAKARKTGDHSSQALLELHIARIEWILGRHNSAFSHFKRGRSTSEGINDPALGKMETPLSTIFFLWQGLFRDAVFNYERVMADEENPEIEKYPEGKLPILARWAVALAYVCTGQVAQGMGMMDGLYMHSRNKGDEYMSTLAGVSMGYLLCQLGRLDEAVPYLKDANKRATRVGKPSLMAACLLHLAVVYYRKKNIEKAIDYTDQFLQLPIHEAVAQRDWTTSLWEICWAMKVGELPYRSGLSLDKEIRSAIRSKLPVYKGLAYYYKALLQRRNNKPHEKIVRSLLLSIKWLDKIGYQLGLAQSRIELAREYLLQGNEKKARQAIAPSAATLDTYGEALVHEDIRFLLKDLRMEKNLLTEIMSLGQELVSIRDHRELVRTILSRVNHITGAERGAIFLIDKGSSSVNLTLRASKNLTAEDIQDANFRDSMTMIRDTAVTGQGRIKVLDGNMQKNTLNRGVIRSCICVPMKFTGKVVGVLYHDNRLFSSTFKESDLPVLTYFAGLAAIAMDNASAYEEIQSLNQKLKQEKEYIEEQHIESLHFGDFVGKSPAIKRVLSDIEKVAAKDASVMILGETGVGKEMVARAIHSHSPRKDKPFITVNCSALPETLITSELFGHEKGAFTGATGRRIGRFELADQGTLFLDEVGDIPMEVQVRLLRVLQTREFERVGGKAAIRSDFRLITATNRDLIEAVKTKQFREDLFFRLNVFPIYVPPLRERKEDIPLLAAHFLEIHSKKAGKQIQISESDMDKLSAYDWPGNVRELENVIERGAILSSRNRFKMPELHRDTPRGVASHAHEALTLREMERRHILWALQTTIWKIRGKGGAAELLDINPNTLYSRMEKLGIKRPRRSLYPKPLQ